MKTKQVTKSFWPRFEVRCDGEEEYFERFRTLKEALALYREMSECRKVRYVGLGIYDRLTMDFIKVNKGMRGLWKHKESMEGHLAGGRLSS